MEDRLELLKFNHFLSDGSKAWSKLYGGFILFIVKAPLGYMACFQIGKIEILIPGYIKESWLKEFEENHIYKNN